MRKLLALVATVAMVLGMFSGVAFAEDPEHKIVLDETIYYVTGDDDDVVKITGEVVTDDDDENPVQNIRVELVQIEADEPSVIFDIDRTDKNGQFTLTLPGDAVSGVYTVLIEDDEVDIYVVPQLTTDDEMKLTWDELQADDFVFQFAGRLAFVPVEYTHVVLKGSAVKEDGGIKFSVARNGRFFVFVEADEFAKPGDLELWLSGEGDDLLLATGKIAAASIAVKLDTDAIVYDLPQTLVAEIDLSKAFPKNADWDVTGAIRTSNGKALADGHNAKVVPVVKNPSGSKYKVTFEFEDLERTDAGNYQVFIQASLDGAAYYAGTAAFSVVRPTTGKLYGMPTSTTVAEGLTLEFGQNGVHVLFRDGATYTVADYYKVSCEGVVAVDETSINLDDGNDDNDAFTAVPKQAGTVVVTIKAYRDNQYKNLLGTFTAEVEIVGGYITVEPGTVPVDSEEKVILTVVDEDEEAVNNAFIYFTDETFEEFDPEETTTTYVIDPREVNIKQGKYTVDLSDEDFEDLVALPKTWNIFAVQAGEVIAAGTLKVVGESVYDVQLDTDVVLAGLSAKLVATVTDEDGKPITPASVTVTNAKGNSQAIGSVKLSKGSAEFTVTLVTAGEYTVTVSTDSDKYLGTATFEVVLPRLELDVENVTNKVNTTLNFVLVDPLTDEILDWEISVKGDAYTTITEATLGETELPVIEDDEDPDMVELFYEDEYTLVLLVEANNVPKDKTAYVSIVAEGVTLAKLPVVGATLTADKELLVIGTPNTVTLTLTDANGKPLEGYKVECGSWNDKTNENGQVTHTIAYVGNDPFNFVATLDAEDATLTKTIKTGVDFDPPVVTYEPVVGLPETTITITDNVRLQRVRVNGVELDFFATASLEHVVKGLQLGDNKIVVEAQDINGNSMKQEITIEYKGIRVPAENQTRRGDFILVQVRQFEDLGVVCDWDPETRTATFTYEENVVQVTIGSSIAVVNGEQVELDVAAEIIGDRTFVPTRFVGESLGLSVHWQPGDIVTIGV